MAAIQGLNELIKEKDDAIREQAKRMQEQASTVSDLSTRLQALEKALLLQTAQR